jgi:methyl-accepting chemotaxis protein
MKIGVRLVVVISIVNLIGIGLLAGITLIQSQREISRLTDEQANSITRENGEKLSKWFEEYIGAARTLAEIMEGYEEIPPSERRGYFDLMLKRVLIAHPELNDVWANWAPNALDGMDSEYANTPGTDETGRYISSWHYLNGAPQLAAITAFDWDTVLSLNITVEYIIDPAKYINPITGQTDFTVVIVIPVRNNGAIVGYVGTTVKVPAIQLIADDIKPFGDGYAFVFSSGGIVAAHTDPERLGKNMKETETSTFGPFLDTMVNAVTKGTGASFFYQPPQSDTVIQYYSVPFSIGNVPQPWTLVVAVSRNTIMAPVYNMLRICLIIGFLAIAFILAGVFLMARSISHPINHLALMLKDISEGEGDLTKTITITAHDEIGDLAHYFNQTIDKIKNLIVSIRKEAQSLAQTGSELASNMTETAAAVNEITANIKSIKEQTNKQQTSVKVSGVSMGQVVDHINTINERIQKQSECVSQSSSAIEEMLANIQSVTQTLVKNEVNVTKLDKASEVGRSSLQEVASDIQEIARDSEGLLEINGVMENIASQTNLLSMNAAIDVTCHEK